MIKTSIRSRIFAGVAFSAALLVVALTGGLRSDWLVLFAPVCYLLGWSFGIWFGICFGSAFFIVLLGSFGYAAAFLPVETIRSDLLAFGLIGLGCLLGLVRWARPAIGGLHVADQLRWNRKLVDFSQSVLAPRDLESALELVAMSLEQVIDAPSRAVLVLDPLSQELRVAACAGFTPEFESGAVIPVDETGIGARLRTGETVACCDAAQDENSPLFGRYDSARAYVLAPLISSAGFFGALYLGWPRPHSVEERSLKRLGEFARSTALSLHRLRAEKEYQRSALVDSLTGLYNQRLLLLRLREESARAQRQQSRLTVILFELQDFEDITGQEGRQVSDLALRAAAEGLIQECRASDTPARHSRDLLAMLCPGLSGAHAAAAADRIRCGIEKAILLATEQEIKVRTASAVFPDGVEDPEKLIDEAMAQFDSAVRHK
ncbi:MAG TPA: diguanylate cyclase [Armatimonadota bacterium]|nr:diguanylate cyclase [Armatimonadota bacterium]